MVKMPNLDELKKMGSGLIDSAKSVDFGGMVDKVKTGMESVGFKKGVGPLQGDEAVRAVFQNVQAILNELNEIQVKQVSLMKQLAQQLPEIQGVVQNYQNIINEIQKKPEDTK